MGYRLRRQITYLFPPGTTPAERLVGLQIAELARESTRIAVINPATILSDATGLGESGVRDALARLRDQRQLEFRVIIAADSRGRPVYACRGISRQYRVPGDDEFKAAWDVPPGQVRTLPSGRWLDLPAPT